MNFKGSTSTGPSDGYEFHFAYDGYEFSKKKDEKFMRAGSTVVSAEGFPEILALARGFVKSALQGKPLHTTVL